MVQVKEGFRKYLESQDEQPLELNRLQLEIEHDPLLNTKGDEQEEQVDPP